MNSENPLKTAAKLSAISNIIDYGVKNSFGELEFEIETMAKKRKFAIDDFESFNEKLKTAEKMKIQWEKHTCRLPGSLR